MKKIVLAALTVLLVFALAFSAAAEEIITFDVPYWLSEDPSSTDTFLLWKADDGLTNVNLQTTPNIASMDVAALTDDEIQTYSETYIKTIESMYTQLGYTVTDINMENIGQDNINGYDCLYMVIDSVMHINGASLNLEQKCYMFSTEKNLFTVTFTGSDIGSYTMDDFDEMIATVYIGDEDDVGYVPEYDDEDYYDSADCYDLKLPSWLVLEEDGGDYVSYYAPSDEFYVYLYISENEENENISEYSDKKIKQLVSFSENSFAENTDNSESTISNIQSSSGKIKQINGMDCLTFDITCDLSNDTETIAMTDSCFFFTSQDNIYMFECYYNEYSYHDASDFEKVLAKFEIYDEMFEAEDEEPVTEPEENEDEEPDTEAPAKVEKAAETEENKEEKDSGNIGLIIGIAAAAAVIIAVVAVILFKKKGSGKSGPTAPKNDPDNTVPPQQPYGAPFGGQQPPQQPYGAPFGGQQLPQQPNNVPPANAQPYDQETAEKTQSWVIENGKWKLDDQQ